MGYFKQKVVWITGASSGIGEALVKEFAKEEASLILSGRNISCLQKLADSLSVPSLILPFDVSHKIAYQQAIIQINEHFGGLDLAILNAGVSVFNDIRNFADSFEQIIPINLMGVVFGIDALLKFFLPENRGHIAVMCSLAGIGGLPEAEAYCASKAAVHSLTQGLQVDLAKTNIKLSTIYPGFVLTPLVAKNTFPMPFLMSPEKAAKIIVSGLKRQKKRIYFPWIFSSFVRCINLLPNSCYEWLVKKFVAKK